MRNQKCKTVEMHSWCFLPNRMAKSNKALITVIELLKPNHKNRLLGCSILLPHKLTKTKQVSENKNWVPKKASSLCIYYSECPKPDKHQH